MGSRSCCELAYAKAATSNRTVRPEAQERLDGQDDKRGRRGARVLGSELDEGSEPTSARATEVRMRPGGDAEVEAGEAVPRDALHRRLRGAPLRRRAGRRGGSFPGAFSRHTGPAGLVGRQRRLRREASGALPAGRRTVGESGGREGSDPDGGASA